jgi:hypothetical protein
MIDYSNKIFVVTKEKTNIKGFWKDIQGKVYKDYIKFYSPETPLDFDNKLSDLFFKGEKAIFVTGKTKAFVITRDKTSLVLSQEILTTKNECFITKGHLKPCIVKDLLKVYGGFTCIKSNEGYTFLIWSK